jgi:FxsC-like protein
MARYYDFFFSFASADWKQGHKDDLQIFFKDLEDKLKTFGFAGEGFFAPDAIWRGREWEDELRQALPASSVLVPAYSPNYFKSVWCGREWEVFWRRQQENKHSPPPDVTAPDVILPVIWTADFLHLPTRVREVQNKAAASDASVYMDYGLGYMMQSPKRFQTKYDDFVHRFAKELAKMINSQGAAKMRVIPDFGELDLPFPTNYKRGLSYVRYVFVAGRHDEMQARRAKVDCYGKFESRQDWRPCFPDVDRAVGDMARAVAAESGKEYDFVKPGAAVDLLKTVREARDLKNVIAVVVDPWSLSLHPFKEFAETFDSEAFPTSGVVVTWNEKDGETPNKLPVLKNYLEDHFRGRLARQEYYNAEVRTPEELRDALVATFQAAQERLVEGGHVPPAARGDLPGQPLLRVTP